ncbi:uncharacterized protein LOC118786437 [Megalops cyprinoides]|uniref:uncharacterized protein LOC118786437 n=1 Tax=Megalops cyprinoides TaxID=118141 RepID=UPI001864AAC0|nr:uncharacterized protein LOC118786437 [Megalops cyprinoides]
MSDDITVDGILVIGITTLLLHFIFSTIVDQNQETSGKLRLESNCSLHINDLTIDDAGRYNCQQYSNVTNYEDTRVVLKSVTAASLGPFSVSSSSSSSELKTGSEVTLYCELQSQSVCTEIPPGTVSWVTETGTPLEGDRYKVEQSICASTLTVTLQSSDHHRNWICQLTREGEVKVSHSYPTILSVVRGVEMPLRLSVFFIVLTTPLVIGAVVYSKRKFRPEADCVSSEPSVHYINIGMSHGSPPAEATSSLP